MCVDLYVSDTATFADYVLPAATIFEKGGLHFLTSSFEPYPFVEWKPKLVEPRGEARPEWEIFKGLSRAAGVPFLNDPLLSGVGRLLDRLGVGFGEEWLYRYLLLDKPRLWRLKRTPGGMRLGDIQWGRFLSSGTAHPGWQAAPCP